MNLYFVRHGETDANVQGIVQGWLDTSLNENGITQAIQAAATFDQNIDAIYSSDLLRAVMTAKEFRKLHEGLPYFEDARLRERSFGDATGKPRDEHDWEQFWSVDDQATIPNGEILNDFTARVQSFLDDIKTTPYQSVLVVTHGGVLNRVQAILDPEHAHHAHANASILAVTL